jgi:hypothetical protein
LGFSKKTSKYKMTMYCLIIGWRLDKQEGGRKEVAYANATYAPGIFFHNEAILN